MDTHTDTVTDKLVELVSFRLGDEEFAVDIEKVQEINRMVAITKLPEVPHYCEGVINLRGKVIPVLDLRRKFEMESKERDKNTRIIVCDTEHGVFGMIVDEVQEVLRLQSSTIEPAPELVTSSTEDYVIGVAKLENRMLIFLDISRIASEAGDEVKTAIDQCGPIANTITENTLDSTPGVSAGIGPEGKATMTSIDLIVTRLKEMTSKLNEGTSELTSASQEVTDRARKTVEAAEHMSGLIGRQAQQAKDVSSTVEETITTFTKAWNESNINAGKLAELIKTIQAETENAMQSVEAGIEVVHKGREIADKAGSSLNQAVSMTKQAMSLIGHDDSLKSKVTTKKKSTHKPVTA